MVKESVEDIEELLKFNPLKMLSYSEEQKELLKKNKKLFQHQSHRLINYLYSIDWRNSIQVA